jgi:hypothetical protein
LSTTNADITIYTTGHYTGFDGHTVHKKSSFLVTGGLFGLFEDLAKFLFTPSSLIFVDPIFVSTVEVTKGTSSHCRLIGGVPLVERVIIACPIILASHSFPEEFICSPCHVNLSLVRFASTTLA